MNYMVNIEDIEQSLINLGGTSTAKSIQDYMLEQYCGNTIPSNYKDERSFRMTIQRKVEDFCPQAKDFDGSKKEGKFLRVGHGTYKLASGYKEKEFLAIEEVEYSENYMEGATKSISVNYYERNQKARQLCIQHHGYSCLVCGFDFANTYGEIGESFIHVHHVVPLSQIDGTYEVDPINDLKPVCANCHAMIHRTNEPLSLEELKENLKSNNS